MQAKLERKPSLPAFSFGAILMTDITRVRYFFNRCHPERPIPADDPDGFYVDFDRNGLRGEKCIDTLRKTIQLSDAPTTQLFTGFPGAGKTSELFRLVEQLGASGYFVVYADCLETLDVLNPIEYSDVLITIGLAVDRALAERSLAGQAIAFGQHFGEELRALLLLSQDGGRSSAASMMANRWCYQW